MRGPRARVHIAGARACPLMRSCVCVCLRASCGVTVLPVVLSMAQGLRQHPSFVVRKVCELSARACETGCRLAFPT